MTWSKSADWIPLSNAIALVNFWQEDLRQSEMYLKTVRSYKKYSIPNYFGMLRIAWKDVRLSKKELIKAKEKLVKTIKRVNK